MDDLNVHPTFDWQTTKEIDLLVSTDYPSLPAGALSRISVYKGNPGTGGKLMKQGSVGVNYSFHTRIRVSTADSSLFLQLATVTGYTETVELPTAKLINYIFSEQVGKKITPAHVDEPDCTSGCDSILTGTGIAVVDNGLVYCITDSYSGHVTMKDGTLKICGTFSGTISMGQVDKPCTLIVSSTGTVAISSLGMTRNCSFFIYGSASVGNISMISNAYLQNYGTLTISNNFSHPGMVRNFGEMIVNGKYSITGTNSELENLGTISISSDWDIAGYVHNYGSVEVFGNINFISKTVYNDCMIYAHQQVVFNTMVYLSNNGYIKSNMEMTVTNGANITLENQSMLSAPVFVMNSTITGTGSSSVIKCAVSGSIIGSQKFLTGPIEMLTPDGTLQSGSFPENFLKGASLLPLADATAYIPSGACNPEGSGQPTVLDSDGDGISNQLDAFPTDGTRAFLSWYPAASSFGSLIFEDLWPYKGDYDMNDAVIDYQFKVITNARNQVVDIQPKFYLRAAGAALKNGFGLQLDGLLPEMVGSVEGYIYKFGYIHLNENGTESSQERAVIIVWDNADNIIHRVGPSSMFNTLPDYPAGYSDSVYIRIHFSVPQDQYTLGPPPYNPFLIKNLDRGVEIHMPDYIPTSLANPIYFGSGEDDSDPAIGRYYKTAKNLLWATNITEKYDYTYETIAILYGYNHFAEWCQASGNSYPNWYLNLPGYRNEHTIYKIP
ncbi:MAG: LruC domain-containing protein [Bacteroidales bacterium]|nr:LruC domain-containing protein [Bacteroidales bacterium]